MQPEAYPLEQDKTGKQAHIGSRSGALLGDNSSTRAVLVGNDGIVFGIIGVGG